MIGKKVYLAGHGGMVGGAILRNLNQRGYTNIITREYPGFDLMCQQEVNDFFSKEMPQIVIIAAAKVGGILANNTYRAQFIYENLMIEANIIHAAFLHGVEKLVFLGSSCIYPRQAPQPLKEEYLLTGELEATNEPYAIAKIAGIKLCESYYHQYQCNFFSVMPTNLYGPHDHFDLTTSHVIPALIHKFCHGRREKRDYVTVWGSGTPMREFLYVDDMADAVVHIMEKVEAHDIYEKGISHINIGTGKDVTIRELAELIAGITGFEGWIEFDATQSDGTPRKLLDVTRLHQLGWKHTTELKEGLERTVQWYLEQTKE